MSVLPGAAALALIIAALYLSLLMASVTAPPKPVRVPTSCRVDFFPLAVKWCWQ